ncbi:MAG: tetratricopeptide repeat protein [Bacteroidales bacterium]|jgi:tetratricopeptide (TPR) repeat protein|nr:tetratricopeptide repeat protein [Bacteroidales bacterium]HOI32760.1 tetratricopeptide repeat protein [Bacteroidales bacterium]
MTYANENLRMVDSLYQLLDRQQGDQRIETMINLSEAYRLISYDKSLKTGQDAVSYAEAEGFQRLKGKVLKSMGISAFQSDDYELAFEYYEQALEAYEKADDKASKGAVLNNIGLVYKKMGDSDKALDYYQQAYAIQFEMNDTQAYASTSNNMASLYYQRGELDKAFDMYYQLQLLFLDMQDSLHYAQVTHNMANVYWQWDQNEKALQLLDEAGSIYLAFNATLDLSRVYYTQGLIYAYDFGDYVSALEKFNLTLDLREKLGNPLGTANVMINVANIWMEQERYEDAFNFYKRGLSIHESIGHTDGILMAYYYMGLANQKIGKYKESNYWLDKCQAKSKAVKSRLYEDLILEARMRNAAATGNYDDFLVYFDQFVIARDSLTDAFNKLQSIVAENRNQIKEQQTTIDQLNETNMQHSESLAAYQNTFYTLLGLLLLVFSYSILKFLLLSFKKFKRKATKTDETYPV